MQENLKIGDTISFIMNGKPFIPVQDVPPPKVAPKVEPVKEVKPIDLPKK